MTIQYRRPIRLCGTGWLLLGAISLNAQFLYSPSRDEKGRAALRVADEVASGQVFDTMIDNLDQLSKASSERFFNDAERKMRANRDSFLNWNSIDAFTKKLESDLQLDLPGETSEQEISAAAAKVKADTLTAEAALEAMQRAAKAKFPAPAEVVLIGNLVRAARGAWRFHHLRGKV